jgi:predicted chitinase
MSYINTLSSQQKNNILILLQELEKSGITNPISQAGILAIISKESSFVPKDENMNYSADRIVTVFKLPYSKAKELANKPEALANYVYGNKNGNTKSGDGWKYRGRGLNGLTFKGNYSKYGNIIGENLVDNPTKVNNMDIASRIQAEFLKNGIKSLQSSGKLSAYNSKDVNGFTNTKDSVLAFYHINAGTGNSVEKIKNLAKNDHLGGMSKALARVDELYKYVLANKKKIPTIKKSNTLINGILFGLLFVSGWVVYRKYKNLPI